MPRVVYTTQKGLVQEVGTGVDLTGASSVLMSSAAFSDSVVLSKNSAHGIKVDPASPTFGFADLLGQVHVRSPGANDPTFAAYSGNIRQFQFSNAGMREAFFEFHVPHDYVLGTDVYIHVHWSQSTVDSGGVGGTPGVVKWQFEITYSKAHNRGAFFTPVVTSVTQQASVTQYQQLLIEIQISATSPSASQIDTDNLEPDGIMLVRVYRDPSDADDTLNQAPFMHYCDIHYQTTGVIGTKNKSPNFYT